MKDSIQATLSRLRQEFISRLPERLVTLEKLLNSLSQGEAGAASTLHREAHSLVGAAGIHRLTDITEAARKLERIAAALPMECPVSETRIFALYKAMTHLMAVAQTPTNSYFAMPATRRGMRILIVEDDPDQALWLRSLCEETGYQVETFNTLDACREGLANGEEPAAIIMDMIFPEGNNAGADFIAELNAQRLIQVPVIFLSVRHDMEARLEAYRAGANRYLTKPVGREELLRTLARSISFVPAKPFRVLLIDDDAEQLAAHALILREAGMEVRQTSNPMEAPNILKDFAAETLLLDMYMPQCTGTQLAAVLRDDAEFELIPVIYLSAETDVAKQLQALDQGGELFLAKPVEPRNLVAAVTVHARNYRQSQEQLEVLRATLYERERQQQALDAHAIVSFSDPAGNITYANEKFCEVTGYSRMELMGKNHRILKSGFHPPEMYQQMWQTISNGQIWHGEVCNKRKDGSLYWVNTTIVPFMDEEGSPYQYISIRTDISSVKEAEERLRRSQIYANIGTWDWNIETGDLFWSERIGPLFGYPEGKLETTYENFLEAVHPEDRQKVVEAVTACVENGAEYNIEHRCVWPDGSVRWLLERGDVVRDAAGKPIHMLGVVQDITKRKEAELALAESRVRLEQAQYLAMLGNWSLDLASGQIEWSSECFRMFQRDPDVFVPTLENYYGEIVHPEDVAALQAVQQEVVETLELKSIDHRILWPDGTVRWVHLEGYAEPDEKGRAATVVGTVQDVTQRKQAEMELADSRARLEEAQALAKLGNWEADMVTGELSWSDEIFRIFGLDPATFTPTVEAFDKAVHPDDVELVDESERKAAITGVHDIVHRIIRPDGEVRYVHELAQAKVGQNGQVLKMSGTVQDVTEIKQAEQAMQQAKEAAEAASRAKSEFLASMSHELRTPLNSILGFAQLFGMDPYLPEKTKEQAHEIERAGKHLLKLVNDLIDLARIEVGKLDLITAPVNLKSVMNDSLSMVAPIARERGISLIEAGGDGRNEIVRADYTRLQQVLINLLANAVKYNRPNGSVHLSCHRGKGSVRISITDDGYGIPQEKQMRLFNAFDRLGAERGQVEGSGIGLVITRSIVEAMGGRIGFESSEGKGSTFWVEFPLATPDKSVTLQDTEIAASKALAQPDFHAHVLYIEDNPMNQRLMQQVFASRGNMELRVTHTAELGIQLAQTDPPALILMDINLPGMDGYAALTVLKADAKTADIPVIAISANAMKGDSQRGLEAGFTAYLTKPIDIPSLFNEIDQAFAQKEDRS